MGLRCIQHSVLLEMIDNYLKVVCNKCNQGVMIGHQPHCLFGWANCQHALFISFYSRRLTAPQIATMS